MKKLKIGLIGFGCVGRGLHDVLHLSRNTQTSIKRIAVKNPFKKRELAISMFSYNPELLIQDPDINTIVELIDDHDAAFTYAKSTLKAGKNFITANKRMLAHHLPELIELAKEQRCSLLYEGAVCGSIPIIRNLEEYYDNDYLSAFSAIVNGTCNYLLTRMEEEQIPIDTAIKEAQSLGFAESNPVLDIEGFDAVFKTVLLVYHSFGVYISPNQIIRWGIQHIKKTDIELASKLKCKIRLLAHAEKDATNRISVTVCPVLINQSHSMFHVRNEMNAVELSTAFADKQIMMGKGAGAFPTGSAVLSDISASAYNYKYEYKKQHNEINPNIWQNKQHFTCFTGPWNALKSVAELCQVQSANCILSDTFLIAECPESLLRQVSELWQNKGLFLMKMQKAEYEILKKSARISLSA